MTPRSLWEKEAQKISWNWFHEKFSEIDKRYYLLTLFLAVYMTLYNKCIEIENYNLSTVVFIVWKIWIKCTYKNKFDKKSFQWGEGDLKLDLEDPPLKLDPLLLAAKKGEIVVDLLLMALIMLNFLEVVKVDCPSSSFFSCQAPT